MISSHEEFHVPDRMKAAVIDRFGHPEEVMHTATIPVPPVGDDKVLIRVGSAGVGAWDPELCGGSFGDDGESFPRVLGSDGAGDGRGDGPPGAAIPQARTRLRLWLPQPEGGLLRRVCRHPRRGGFDNPAHPLARASGRPRGRRLDRARGAESARRGPARS